jgi:LemA protein
MGFSEAPYLEFDLSSMKEISTLKEFKTDDGERLEKLLTGAGNQLVGASKSLTHL